ncbi:MAG: RluA family pseudouridine synthase, partial [Epsilonproteobacteria bacterium]|nr:RluA family pseudouridine synthase [Campylobacterota bacterium]
MEMDFICKEKGRLDKILQSKLEVPRNQVENLIKEVGVKVNDKVIKKSGFKLKEGDKVIVTLPRKEDKEYKDVDFDIDIIYEDENLLVINKPPFITVHPAPSVKEPTVVDWLRAKGISLSTLAAKERHGIVHRIDKETSGALVIAKNNDSHLALSRQLEDKSMGRYYLSIIDLPLKEDMIVERPIARNPKNRLKMGIVPSGREAKSAFIKLLLSKKSKKELIAAKLFTGRTHQIRVHLSSLSRHILGDHLYGFKSKSDKINRIMLHAYIIYFIHPRTKQPMLFKAPLFEDFKETAFRYFDTETFYEK